MDTTQPTTDMPASQPSAEQNFHALMDSMFERAVDSLERGIMGYVDAEGTLLPQATSGRRRDMHGFGRDFGPAHMMLMDHGPMGMIEAMAKTASLDVATLRSRLTAKRLGVPARIVSVLEVAYRDAGERFRNGLDSARGYRGQPPVKPLPQAVLDAYTMQEEIVEALLAGQEGADTLHPVVDLLQTLRAGRRLGKAVDVERNDPSIAVQNAIEGLPDNALVSLPISVMQDFVAYTDTSAKGIDLYTTYALIIEGLAQTKGLGSRTQAFVAAQLPTTRATLAALGDGADTGTPLVEESHDAAPSGPTKEVRQNLIRHTLSAYLPLLTNLDDRRRFAEIAAVSAGGQFFDLSPGSRYNAYGKDKPSHRPHDLFMRALQTLDKEARKEAIAHCVRGLLYDGTESADVVLDTIKKLVEGKILLKKLDLGNTRMKDVDSILAAIDALPKDKAKALSKKIIDRLVG